MAFKQLLEDSGAAEGQSSEQVKLFVDICTTYFLLRPRFEN